MTPESAKDFYDRQYTLHKEGRIVCPYSLHDLQKAQRRVRGVIRALGISNRLQGAKVLDVGCGLGFYTKALSSTGAKVTGIDISKAGVELARTTFPECDFRCAAWPEDVEKGEQFDLIWTVALSLINTYDVGEIHARLVLEAIQRLKPNGFLVLGWGSDFSGRTGGNWSHWSIGMLRRMRRMSGLSAPIVPEAGAPWLSAVVVRAGYLLGKEVPIFMYRKKEERAGVS